MKPTIKEYLCTRGGAPGILHVETSKGNRPEYRFGWDLYSTDSETEGRVWTLELFVPDEEKMKGEHHEKIP